MWFFLVQFWMWIKTYDTSIFHAVRCTSYFSGSKRPNSGSKLGSSSQAWSMAYISKQLLSDGFGKMLIAQRNRKLGTQPRIGQNQWTPQLRPILMILTLPRMEELPSLSDFMWSLYVSLSQLMFSLYNYKLWTTSLESPSQWIRSHIFISPSWVEASRSTNANVLEICTILDWILFGWY